MVGGHLSTVMFESSVNPEGSETVWPDVVTNHPFESSVNPEGSETNRKD